ncbi:MAG: hypothetical protein QOH63_2288 [Acidobacteriota bacterium]|nr:hypothetical protein [Acidobacteriota bacterium]
MSQTCRNTCGNASKRRLFRAEFGLARVWCVTTMPLNKSLYRFLGLSAFVVSAMFLLLAIMLYRSGGNYWTSIYVAAFELIAGLYLLRKSR